MAKQVFTNNALSQLSGSLPQGGTTLVCSAGQGARFPSLTGGDFFYLTLYTKDAYTNEQNVEIVKVTARVGDVFTVVRDIEVITGQAGGFAYNGSLDTVYLEIRWTAGCVDNMAQKSDLVDVVTGGASGFMTGTDKAKLDGVASGANNYTHPGNHAPSIITQDSSNRFVTDAEKTSWNAKGDVTASGTQTLTNKTLTGYTETVYGLAGTDISIGNGTIQTKTLAANTTFTESLADGQSVILGITAGAYTVTWPGVTWTKVGGSGVAPTLTSTGVNWVVLWQVGGVVRGSFLGTA